MKRYEKKRSVIVSNIILFLISTVVCILVIETIFSLLLEDQKIVQITSIHDVEADQDLGYVLKKNSTHNSIRALLNGSISYNSIYTTDGFRRRTIFQEYKIDDPHILLFGDSVTFGQGLNTDETLAYFLHRKIRDTNIYNYAVSGYGPTHALAKLESESLKDEISSEKGVAIYVLIPAHVHRAAGNSLAEWIYDSPYYALDEDDNLVRKGSFRSGRPAITEMYEAFNWIRKHSSLLQYLNINLPPWTSKKDIDLTARILKRSKELYEAQFEGPFIVVFHPDWNRSLEKIGHDEMKKELTDLGIRTLDYSSYPFTDDLVIPYDNHPNAELNKDLSELIREDLVAEGLVKK